MGLPNIYRRKVATPNRNIAYAVTPAGVEAITKRSYRYLRRTIRNIVYYREAIEAFVQDVKSLGYQGIAFAGVSDLDFIVEHACEMYGIRYLRDDASIEVARAGSDELYLLYSEGFIPDEEEKRVRPAAAFLQEVVSQAAGEDAAGRRNSTASWTSKPQVISGSSSNPGACAGASPRV